MFGFKKFSHKFFSSLFVTGALLSASCGYSMLTSEEDAQVKEIHDVVAPTLQKIEDWGAFVMQAKYPQVRSAHPQYTPETLGEFFEKATLFSGGAVLSACKEKKINWEQPITTEDVKSIQAALHKKMDDGKLSVQLCEEKRKKATRDYRSDNVASIKRAELSYTSPSTLPDPKKQMKQRFFSLPQVAAAMHSFLHHPEERD